MYSDYFDFCWRDLSDEDDCSTYHEEYNEKTLSGFIYAVVGKIYYFNGKEFLLLSDMEDKYLKNARGRFINRVVSGEFEGGHQLLGLYVDFTLDRFNIEIEARGI